MATTVLLPLTTTTTTLLLLLLSLQIQAQTPAAPAPSPSGPINITGILDKNGQYTVLIQLLATTQVGNQLQNQLNTTTEGFTFFTPTDNAFNTLKPEYAVNKLSPEEQVQLVLGHVIPKYYTLPNLLLASNPVRTQGSSQDGDVIGLNFTGQGNQVNVSTGIVETQINNALRQESPLAMYQVDKVLLPEVLFGVKPPAAAPAPPAKTTTPSGSATNNTAASEPASDNGSSGGGITKVALGFLLGLGLACMGVLS